MRLFDTDATFGRSQGTRQGQDRSLAEPVGFGETGETRFTHSSVTQEGNVAITQIQYRFPVGDRLKVYLEADTTDPSHFILRSGTTG